MNVVKVIREYLKDNAFMERSPVKKRWVTRPIDTTCPSCKAMNGQVRKWNEKFSDPTGTFDDTFKPPLHGNCRCTIEKIK